MGATPVCHSRLLDGKMYAALLQLDLEQLEEAQSQGCAYCGGPLDRGDYPRKPRGGPEGVAALLRRLSLCCRREGCRRRSTPPSVLFLGRRVYLATVVVLVAVLRHGLTPRRMDGLRRAFGVSRRTLLRWRAWWRDTFVATRCWREVRGRIVPAVNEAEVVRELFDRFSGDFATRFRVLLRTLSPVTACPGLDLERAC